MDSTAADISGGPVAPTGEIEELRSALQKERQRYSSLLADFDSSRRRMTREQSAAAQAGRREALLPLLDVLDALEQALGAGSSDADFYRGVDAIRRLFVSALRNVGAEPIPALGQVFDPTLHDAMATVASENVSPGTIIREERSGWRLGGELLRPAQVVVAAAEAAEPRQ